MSEEKKVVASVDRCIDILEYVSNQSNPVNVKEISENLHIPIASCFRIIKNLSDRGYIEKSSSSDRYYLGMKIMELAEKKERTLNIRSIALPYMNSLAMSVNQVVQLGRLENNGVIYIEQALPISPINVIGALYTPLSVNVSASGKVLCAYLPIYEQALYIEKSVFSQLTENSIMNKMEFKKHLMQVKEQGYARDNEEYSIGIGCLAVPIFNYSGKCVASLGVTGNNSEYEEEQHLNFILSKLKETASNISIKMGAKNC